MKMRPPVKPMATTISLVQKGHSSTPASGPKHKHTEPVSQQAGGVKGHDGGEDRAVLTIWSVVLQQRNSP